MNKFMLLILQSAFSFNPCFFHRLKEVIINNQTDSGLILILTLLKNKPPECIDIQGIC